MNSIGPGVFWEAYAEKGKPWCVGTGAGGGFSAELYFSKKGALKGVCVVDMETGEAVVVGKVPKRGRYES